MSLSYDTRIREKLAKIKALFADHIIADYINPDRSDAEVVAGLPGPAAGSELEG